MRILDARELCCKILDARVLASPVPSVVRGSFVVKFLIQNHNDTHQSNTHSQHTRKDKKDKKGRKLKRIFEKRNETSATTLLLLGR